jgi:hypothetical protein
MRTIRVPVIAVFLAALAGAAVAADYWPLTPGASFIYQGSGEAVTADILINTFPGRCLGWFDRRVTAPGYGYLGHDYYLNGAGGDILWGGHFSFGEGDIDPNEYYYSPPVVLVDPPLTVGKQWQTQTTVDYIYGSYPATFICTVTGAETVTTPAGDFETLVLQVFEMPRCSIDTYYLHRQLGPVDEGGCLLTGWTGVVANDRATWGEVKALYGR